MMSIYTGEMCRKDSCIRYLAYDHGNMVGIMDQNYNNSDDFRWNYKPKTNYYHYYNVGG